MTKKVQNCRKTCSIVMSKKQLFPETRRRDIKTIPNTERFCLKYSKITKSLEKLSKPQSSKNFLKKKPAYWMTFAIICKSSGFLRKQMS